MKSKLTAFAGMALSREQMKASKGGCQICSTPGPNGPAHHPVYGDSGTCGGHIGGADARAQLAELRASGDNYVYELKGSDC